MRQGQKRSRSARTDYTFRARNVYGRNPIEIERERSRFRHLSTQARVIGGRSRRSVSPLRHQFVTNDTSPATAFLPGRQPTETRSAGHQTARDSRGIVQTQYIFGRVAYSRDLSRPFDMRGGDSCYNHGPAPRAVAFDVFAERVGSEGQSRGRGPLDRPLTALLVA